MQNTPPHEAPSVDPRYDVLQRWPSQMTLLCMGATLAAFVIIMSNKKTQTAKEIPEVATSVWLNSGQVWEIKDSKDATEDARVKALFDEATAESTSKAKQKEESK